MPEFLHQHPVDFIRHLPDQFGIDADTGRLGRIGSVTSL